jgi:hypothetical protein
MPAIISDLNKRRKMSYSGREEYEYDYPRDFDLKPNSAFHIKLKNGIYDRAMTGHHAIQKRFDSWNEIDRTLTTYIKVDDTESDLQDADERTPVSIVYPYTYAIFESMMAYMVSAFLDDPIFRYEGAAPGTTLGAIMLEKVINQHCHRNKVGLALHTLYGDDFRYGFGVAAPTWTKIEGWKTRKANPIGVALQSMFGIKPEMKKTRKRATLFEGNDLINISPYDCLPDPNVPIHNALDGEYFGWIERSNLNALLTMEKNGKHMFNAKYLRHHEGRRTSILSIDESARNDKTGGSMADQYENTTNPVDVIHLYWNLIPTEWDLGDSEYPEIWYFKLAADCIILEARPLGTDYDRFPVAISSSNFDGYASCPTSRLENLFGMQKVLDWMFNSHVSNVRKAVNDMLVVDPYLVNINDLKSPKPGKLIRMRRPAWGRGVENAVMQLGVNDVTRGHIADASFIIQGMQKVGGVDEPAMGSLRQGGPERLTGQEFAGTQRGTFTRLERIAKIIGMQAMRDIGFMFASNTQQLMSKETYVKTAGSWEETLRNDFGIKGKMLKVTPYDLLIDYDLIVKDGSVPGGNFSPIWKDIFQIISQNQELHSQFDLVRIFKYIARESGAKDVDQFARVQPIQQEQIPQQVQQGNIVPINQGIPGMAAA